MLNSAIIMGRLTAAPELRTTQSGKSFVPFCVAVDRNRTNSDGTRDTDFINCVAWSHTADFISRYFTKGQMIAVQGSIQTKTYDDKQGNKRMGFEIVAQEVSFCGSKQESAGLSHDESNQPDEEPAPYVPYEDDDLPFG